MPIQPFIQICSLVTFDEQLTCALENCCRTESKNSFSVGFTVPLINLLTNIAVQNGIVSRYYHGPYPIMSHRKIQAVTQEYPERNRQGSRD